MKSKRVTKKHLKDLKHLDGAASLAYCKLHGLTIAKVCAAQFMEQVTKHQDDPDMQEVLSALASVKLR